MNSKFVKLLDGSTKLASDIGESHQSNLNRGLEEIALISRTLAEKPEGRINHEDRVTARYTLANKGYNMEGLSKSLQNLKEVRTFEPLVELPVTDVEGYVKHQHEIIISGILEETKKHANEEFERCFEDMIHNYWEKKKEVIVGHGMSQRGIKQQESVSEIPRIEPEDSLLLLKKEQKVFEVGEMTEKMRKYSSALSKVCFSGDVQHSKILAALAEANDKSSSENAQQKETIANWWRTLHIMMEEVDVGSQKRKSQIEINMLSSARKFLEDDLFHMVRATSSSSNFEHTSIGTRSLFSADLSKYIIRLRENGIIDGQSDSVDWARIYFALRCGALDEFLLMSRQEGLGLLEEAHGYVFSGQRYPPELSERLSVEFNSSKGNLQDQFKVAVYNLLGRFDIDMYGFRSPSMEDWMWCKFWFLSDPTVFSENEGGLEALQLSVVENKAIFSYNGEKPLVYVNFLLLSQLFDEAIEVLRELVSHKIELIHLAVALQMRRSDGNILLNKTYNFVLEIIEKYALSFCKSDPKEAAVYLSLIGDEFRKVDSLATLVIESNNFDLVYYGEDMERGILFELGDDNTCFDVIRKAGAKLSEYGRYYDAVLLYIFAGDLKNSVLLLSRALGASIAKFSMDDVVELNRVVSKMRKLQNDQRRRSSDSSTENLLRNFSYLESIAVFFADYNSGNFSSAHQRMTRIDILPVDGRPVAECTKLISPLSDIVKRNLGLFFHASVTALYKLYQKGGSEQQKESLRRAAENLSYLTSTLSLRLSDDRSRSIRKMVNSMRI